MYTDTSWSQTPTNAVPDKRIRDTNIDEICEEVGQDAALGRLMLEDNAALRKAGCNLAEAALRVVNTHDGIHRLALAIAEWANTLACEGNRPHYKDKI